MKMATNKFFWLVMPAIDDRRQCKEFQGSKFLREMEKREEHEREIES